MKYGNLKKVGMSSLMLMAFSAQAAWQSNDVIVCKDKQENTITAKIIDLGDQSGYVRIAPKKKGSGRSAYYPKKDVVVKDRKESLDFTLLKKGQEVGSLSIAANASTGESQRGTLELKGEPSSPLTCDLNLALRLAKTSIDDVWEKLYTGFSVDPKTLTGNAAAAYKRATADELKEETTVERIDVAGFAFIHISDVIDGTGCHKFFTEKGKYVNSLCGTESSEWNWSILR